VAVKGIDGMSPQEIGFEINRGGKFVRYRYCVSLLVITFFRGTDVHFVRANESRLVKALPWILTTLVAGWWGIPWGPIRSIHSLWINFQGGEDLTAAFAKSMNLTDVKWDVAGAS